MKVALIQLNADSNKEKNFLKAMRLLKRSLKNYPDVICLPEMFLYLGDNKIKEAEEINSKYLKAFQDFALENNVNLILGSVAFRSKIKSKITNTCFVINRKGKIILRYDKSYMFDVKHHDIIFNESASTIPGEKLGFFILDGIKMGVGICYDLRYPEYFRKLVKKGVKIIFLPANFRKRTGKIAWECLTSTRAIENQVYFCACNQTGGMNEKERCGNTRIVSYEGSIMKNLKCGEGIIFADLDLEILRKFRNEFPVLSQMREI